MCKCKRKKWFIILALYVCSRGVYNKKPHNKEQQAIWRIECALGVIKEPDCPIDGGWSPWSPWSFCHGNCDDVGHRRRIRQCTNPPASKDGTPCSGPDDQIEPCYKDNCTLVDFQKLVEGDIVRTEALHQLETIPLLMEHCLTTECPFESVEMALAADNTWKINPEIIWNSLQCVKHNLGCPVIGEWGTWGSWSVCGALCGRGLHWRIRRCDTPPPSDANLICLGNPLQTEKCEGDYCAIDEKYTDQDTSANWSLWGEWSKCSEICGKGIRRRRRTCVDKQTTRISANWGTHCRGQYNQLEICENKKCILNGGWSGWSTWGPCSQSCGTGRRFRTRACTRPIPSGGGTHCVGSKIEEGSCNLIPCEVYTHVIALFNGDSILQYHLPHKRSTLFQCYIRFMPLSPHGSLIRQGNIYNPTVRLSLQNWHICLDARGSSQSCSVLRLCSASVIEPTSWHTVLVSISNEAVTIRLNDAQIPIRGTFPCNPELINDAMSINIGENFHGALQEIIVNFMPLDIIFNGERKMRSDLNILNIPSSALNIAYEKANIEEAYLQLKNGQYLRLPCFENQNEWKLELTAKPKREVGSLIFMQDDQNNNWLHMFLENTRLKIKLAFGDFRSESSSYTECLSGQWLHVTLCKKKESTTIEASINSDERMHIFMIKDSFRERRDICSNVSLHEEIDKNSTLKPKNSEYENKEIIGNTFILCTDEFYVGSVPFKFKEDSIEELTSFSGLIASLRINNILLDLHSYSVERYKDDNIQVSSRTASISGYYNEITWGISNSLNLTCLHARTRKAPNSARWLYLDTTVNSILKDRSIRSIDDGRILKLITTGEKDIRGFYTCRAHTNKLTRNILTYGVIGKLQYNLPEPDVTTMIAVFTTILLVVATLAWLIIEGINDLHNGFGFFRDAHLSPEEEAEAVCKYIDQNIHLISSNTTAKIAKTIARRKGRQLASRLNFAAQEPQGLMQLEKKAPGSSNKSITSEPELPALPEIKRIATDAVYDVYRCEPSYASSPRHGSNITLTDYKLTSSSIKDSPRMLCSGLLTNRYNCLSGENLIYKMKVRRQHLNRNKMKQMINESKTAYSEISPAHKTLQKFHSLKLDD